MYRSRFADSSCKCEERDNSSQKLLSLSISVTLTRRKFFFFPTYLSDSLAEMPRCAREREGSCHRWLHLVTYGNSYILI